MLYRILVKLVKLFLWAYHRVEVYGKENIPSSGPLIVVGNHSSYLDSIYMIALFPRKIHFMAKEELFRNRLMRFVLQMAGSFPVNREKPDLKTFKTALNLLGNDQVVGIFPEGGMVDENGFQDLKQGAAYIAIKGNANILPLYLDGAQKAMKDLSLVKPVKIRLTIGKVIEIPTEGSVKDNKVKVSEQMQESLLSLREDAQTRKRKFKFRKKRKNKIKKKN